MPTAPKNYGTTKHQSKLTWKKNANQRGYNYRWQQSRAAYLAANPYCTACMKTGRPTPATVVDHIVPHRGDGVLFWDAENWQPLCAKCHNKKTGEGQ